MSGYIGTQPVPQATQTRDSFTCTAGQTSFATGGYTPTFLDVYLNGIFLANGADYTASNGSDVILTAGAAAGDILEVVAYTSFEVVNDTVTNAGTVLNLDRTGSDGTILDLKKDGSTVGSIGSAYGVISYINLDPRSGGTGVGATNTDSVIPVTGTGVSANGTKDLGISSARWRDLYLSGGVYLGGTGSANKLDDYEEGTWTPTMPTQSGTDYGISSTTAKYTKIGNVVTVEAEIIYTSRGSGTITLLTLPFAAESSLEILHGWLSDAHYRRSVQLLHYAGNYVLLRWDNGNSFINYWTPSNEFAASGTFRFSGTYRTA